MLDWLPGATRRPMHESGFDWQVSCPTKGILHTTEGFGVPAYPSQYEPHLTVVATRQGVDVYQHIPFTKAAYALKHPAGTAATNGAHAIQIELAGTCDPHGPKGAYYWPRADDAVLRDLYLKVIHPLSAAYGIHLTAPLFKAYPASAGANGVRFTEREWLAWNGWAGHQHVPGNDHGDPGAFPFARMLAAGRAPAKAKPKVTPGKVVAVGVGAAAAAGAVGVGVTHAPTPTHPLPTATTSAARPSVKVTTVPAKPTTPTAVKRPARHAAPAPLITGPLAYGSTGESVRTLQKRLGVDVDGIFGRITLRHVVNAQRAAHITADGVAGPTTARALGLRYRPA